MAELTVDVRVVAASAVAVVWRTVGRGELSRVVPELCGRVWTHLRAQQIKGGRNVAIYYDRGARVAAGVEVAVPFIEGDDVVRAEIPAGRAATTTLFGPYAGLGRAHDTVQAWCRQRGHRLVEPCWELYGHWQREWDADASLIRTDVFYLIDG